MPAQNETEMQYQTADQMVAKPSQAPPSNMEACEAVQDDKPKRTFLGMRGGGIILDLCACFICCECMDGCCHAIDDCCCC